MYFFDINGAKAQLVDGALRGAAVLPYLLAYGVMTTLVYDLLRWSEASRDPATALSLFDWLNSALALLCVIVGTVFLYRRNGGSEGELLAERYLVVGWVVSLRVLLVFLPVVVVFSLFLQGGGEPAEPPPPAGWPEVAASLVFGVSLYWRMGVHVADVVALRHAARTPPTIAQLTPLQR